MKCAPKLLVCGSKKCRKRGSLLLMAHLGELLTDLPELKLDLVGCQKRCRQGYVVVLVEKKSKVWKLCTPEDARKLAGKVRKRLTKWRQTV